MRKPLIVVMIVAVLGWTLPQRLAQAQSTSAPAGQAPASAQKPTAPKTQAAPGAAKAGQKPGAKKAPALTLKTDKDKISYAIGMSVGKSLPKDLLEVDPNILLRGIKDAQAGGKTLLTEEETRTVLTTLQTTLRKKMEEKNQRDGEAFLVTNKLKEGVVTLPSGLQYKILKEGTGPKPTTGDSVVCNYRGTLINNKEFDSSYKRGQPATFPVTGVIKGWTEALQLMPVGSKWQLFVPSDLAYGPRSAGPDIGPNSTLIFEVELLSIQPKAPKPEAARPEGPKQ
jgi:FKBP-type peptidyl-prolyl cis-trans isomerase FklB